MLVGFISTSIQKKIIANEIKESFENAFSDLDFSNEIEDNVEQEEKIEKVETPVFLNKTFKVGDIMELTFESSEWLDEIKPSNTSGVYSYKTDNENEKYFVIKGKVKNLAGESFDIQYINESEILINDTYKANVIIEAEESDGTSFYGSVKPLQTLNIIAYASVSDELYSISEDVKFTLNVLNDSTYIGYYFDEDKPYDIYTIEFNN